MRKIIYTLIFCLIISCSSPNNQIIIKEHIQASMEIYIQKNGNILCYELGVNTASTEAQIYNAAINFDIGEDKIIVNVYQDGNIKETFEQTKYLTLQIIKTIKIIQTALIILQLLSKRKTMHYTYMTL